MDFLPPIGEQSSDCTDERSKLLELTAQHAVLGKQDQKPEVPRLRKNWSRSCDHAIQFEFGELERAAERTGLVLAVEIGGRQPSLSGRKKIQVGRISAEIEVRAAWLVRLNRSGQGF